MNRLAKSLVAISLVGMTAGTILSKKPDLEEYSKVTPQIEYSTQKQAQRNTIVANAEHLLGRPYFSQENPESLSCIDVYVKSVCGLEEQLRNDYHSLPIPERRYASLDLRVPTLMANVKALVSNDFNNTPNNPFFVRRIQNVIRYQQAHGLFFKPNENCPQPGMIVYWAKRNSDFPTHAGVIVSVNGDQVREVIHASATKGKVMRSSEQNIEDAGYYIYGFGDTSN